MSYKEDSFKDRFVFFWYLSYPYDICKTALKIYGGESISNRWSSGVYCIDMRQSFYILYNHMGIKKDTIYWQYPVNSQFICKNRTRQIFLDLPGSIFSIYFFRSFMKAAASLIKLADISTITRAIGNAAIMLTDCRLAIELSENTSAMGNRISRMHHISWISR